MADYTLEQLARRHSVRNYSAEAIPDRIVRKLKAEITMVNTHEAGMHFRLFTNDAAPFDGFRASYGMFRNVRNYIACVVDRDFPDFLERAGYFAQSLVMSLVKEGLGTCFVGATYDSSKIDMGMRAGWELPFVIAFGYPSDKGESLAAKIALRVSHRKKMSLGDFYIEEGVDYENALSKFPILPDILKAISLAPSALNKRPVRVTVKETDSGPRICIGTKEKSKFSQIDLGIAKFNVSTSTGVWSEWGNFSPIELP